MRLSIQGCLILLLCFLSSLSFADAPDPDTVYWSRKGVNITSQSDYDSAYDESLVQIANCQDSHASCTAVWDTWSTRRSDVYVVFNDSCSELYIHDPDPITGEIPVASACTCAAGWKQKGVDENNVPHCVIDRQQSPEECKENGQLYNSEQGYCVLECEETALNGACLPDPEPNNDCTKDSPDYRGQVVLGYGKEPINACGDFDQCSGDKPGQVGFMNGELRCISEDYGAPKCKGGSITVMDEYGFICSTLENKPEEPEMPEEPNTDTDGDGQPDEYQKDNDPNINRKQLDDLKKSQDDANKSLGNLEQLGKSGNKILKDIEGNTGKSANELEGMGDSLSDIKKNTKDTADNLQDIEDGLTAPSEGYGLGGLLGIPTLSETAGQFKSTIMGTSIAQSIDGLTSVPSSTMCPVWTIPKTMFWDAIPMDSHCQAIEAQRGNLGTIFMFFWTGIALFTFWKA